MTDDLSRFCCQNPECPDHGRRRGDNLRVAFRYGPHRRLMLACRTCQARFSERKGTPLFDARLPDGQVLDVLAHLQGRCGVRQTSRLVGVDKDTVVRYALRAGDHARQLHDELPGFSPNTRAVEFDEQWSFVGKKEKNCDHSRPEDDWSGDCRDHLAFDPEHRLVVSLVCGRRSEGLTFLLVADFYERTGGRVMDPMTGDEYAPCAAAVLETYGEAVVPERTGRPGRPAKGHKEAPPGLTYATVHKEREGGRVVSVTTRVVYGTEEAAAGALESLGIGEKVNTAHEERFHGTGRNRNGRKVRRAYTFSKDGEVHVAVTQFVRYSYNFCRPVGTLRVRGASGVWEARTPAMSAGLADQVWPLWEWLTLPAGKRTKAAS